MSNYFVHESAIIDENVIIGTDTMIWHFCHVGENARIGANCTLGQNIYVAPGVVIGNGVKIQNNVSIYRGVTLEDKVFCGPSVVFTNVLLPRAGYPKVPEREYLPTLVKKGATLGANATILCGITIGRCAFIGAGAVVTENVPDHALVHGNPARLHGWICACGETRSSQGPAGLNACPRCGTQ